MTSDAVASVLPAVRIPGRFQRIGKFVLDVAHNLEGMLALRDTLQDVTLPRPLIAVVGILRDKQWVEMIRVLAPAVDSVVLTSPARAPADRRWDPDEVRRGLSEIAALEVVPDLAVAMAGASAVAGTVLVCGSFYTAGEALAHLGAIPDHD